MLNVDIYHSKVGSSLIGQINRQSGLPRKYHLVSWGEICRSNDHGGLGVLDLRTMDLVLMVKRW